VLRWLRLRASIIELIVKKRVARQRPRLGGRHAGIAAQVGVAVLLASGAPLLRDQAARSGEHRTHGRWGLRRTVVRWPAAAAAAANAAAAAAANAKAFAAIVGGEELDLERAQELARVRQPPLRLDRRRSLGTAESRGVRLCSRDEGGVAAVPACLMGSLMINEHFDGRHALAPAGRDLRELHALRPILLLPTPARLATSRLRRLTACRRLRLRRARRRAHVQRVKVLLRRPAAAAAAVLVRVWSGTKATLPHMAHRRGRRPRRERNLFS
jgi:hypothetical protein